MIVPTPAYFVYGALVLCGTCADTTIGGGGHPLTDADLSVRGMHCDICRAAVGMPPTEPRLFMLRRVDDETGVSGTGRVADGVRFASGKCALNWRTDVSSTAVYDSLKELCSIHGHGGKTKAYWTSEQESFDGSAIDSIHCNEP